MLAGAAVASALALATPASAAHTIYLERATMDTTYRATISGINGSVYSNGVTFRVNDNPGSGSTLDASDYSLFGFCIDIFHDMYINTTLNYAYSSNYGDPGQALYTNYGPTAPTNVLSGAQITKLTNLIDTGYLLHQAQPNSAAVSMQTAAIQAAIWAIANPTRTVTVTNTNLNQIQFGQYQSAYNNYVAGTYTSLADANDRAYTITDLSRNPQHQTFAVGWPIDNAVPEPGTWALMIVGFGFAGTAIRRQRTTTAA